MNIPGLVRKTETDGVFFLMHYKGRDFSVLVCRPGPVAVRMSGNIFKLDPITNTMLLTPYERWRESVHHWHEASSMTPYINFPYLFRAAYPHLKSYELSVVGGNSNAVDRKSLGSYRPFIKSPIIIDLTKEELAYIGKEQEAGQGTDSSSQV